MRGLGLLALVALMAAASGLPVSAADAIPHEARDLEATLPAEVPGPTYHTSSLVGEAAAREWDESYPLRYILACTCRSSDDFQMAVLEGYDPSVPDEHPGVDPWTFRDIAARALRFAGADAAQLRESYLQAMRFGGPPSEDAVEGPYGGFVAAAGWRPATVWLGEHEAVRYGTDGDTFYAYFADDTVYEVDADRVDAGRILAGLPTTDSGDSGDPGSAPTLDACPGASEELLALLPRTLGDTELEPYPLPPGYAAGWLSPTLAETDDAATVSGYLLFVSLGSIGAAFHAPGVEPARLMKACLSLLDLRKREVRVVDWAGRQVSVDKPRYSACYVRGDMVFAITAPGMAKPFIRSIPLPGAGADDQWSEPSVP